MANRERGEIDQTIDGTTYTYVITTEAMVQLEDLFSTPDREVTFQDVIERVNKGSIKYQRALVWAGLLKYHKLTLKEVGELIDRVGGLGELAVKMQSALSATTPDPEDEQTLLGSVKGEREARPPAAQDDAAGTGGRSTSRRGARD